MAAGGRRTFGVCTGRRMRALYATTLTANTANVLLIGLPIHDRILVRRHRRKNSHGDQRSRHAKPTCYVKNSNLKAPLNKGYGPVYAQSRLYA
jgi:hypothetical protein